MSDNNKLNKLMLLKRAVDQLHSDELPEWEQDLMEGAWQILHDEPGTGINERYKDWAEIFANERTVEIYEQLAEVTQKLHS